jgi:hypothetical protein
VEIITQEPFDQYYSNLAHWLSMLRARTPLFLGDLGQIGQGHLGKIDIVWPILFKLAVIDKRTKTRNCAYLWVTFIERVKVIWGEIEKSCIDDNSRTI